MPAFSLRTICPEDCSEVAELIYSSINVWYQTHGAPAIFHGGPQVTEIFYDVYNDLTPDRNVIAVNDKSGRIMGSCFYHPRKHHVSLGIMTVHPNYFGCGVGGALLRHIIDFTDEHNYSALRLTQSALNVDSFSLYNKAGFVPRYAYQDMLVSVPDAGGNWHHDYDDRVRDAVMPDIPEMIALEMSVSGISREEDYRYCIQNSRGIWHVSVAENPSGKIEGFLISCGHPAMNLIGPGVASNEQAMVSLICRELNQYPGRMPVVLVPMEKDWLVRQLYELGARNCEMHFCQVRGQFQPFNGVNIPTFLPETG